MRKKFKVIIPDTGLEFKPGHGNMVMMNQDGIFFIGKYLDDYYPSVAPLKNTLPKYMILYGANEMKARTIPWNTIADWYDENEQGFRDVMRFEGLRGVVNDVLQIAPDQPEVITLREQLTKAEEDIATLVYDNFFHQTNSQRIQRELTEAEQRNSALVKTLTDTREALGREYWDQYAGLDETRDILDAALKPTAESGVN